MRGETAVGFGATLLVSVFLLMSSYPVAAFAQRPDGPPALESLAALTGGTSWEESSASPVLRSDIELEALLLLVREHGADWRNHPVGEALLRRAFRSVSLTKLLSHIARQYEETVEPEVRKGLVDAVITKAGGDGAMDELLSLCGAERADLDVWAQDAALAAARIATVRERVEPPSEVDMVSRFEKGGHPFAGKELNDVRRPFRRWMMEEDARRALEDDIRETLSHQPVRVIE